MNEHIETFLSKYTCTETNGYYWGEFSNTQYLHKVRDVLTHDDWLDLFALVQPGLPYLPANLKKSLVQKFEAMEEFQIENRCEYQSPDCILYKYVITGHKQKVQKLTWGLITSCIECEYFRRLSSEPVKSSTWSPFK